jgi:hypothetical protein
MASEYPAIFKKLKRRFKKGHSSAILLSFCHLHADDGLEFSTSVSRVYKKEFTIIGLMSIPVIHPSLLADLASELGEEMKRRIADRYIMASSQIAKRKTKSQTHSAERLLVVYAATNNHEDRKAAEQLKSYMHEGGANLPLSFLHTIPWQSEPRAYESRWLQLMFWNNPPSLSDFGLLNLYPDEHRIIFWKPFEDSAKVIESCKLETEKAVFQTVDSEWPIWAGEICRPDVKQKPRTAKQSATIDPWHKADDMPPSKYCFGPLSGKKEDLTRWICPETKAMKTLARPITEKLKRQPSQLWGQEVHAKFWRVYFANQTQFDEANKRYSQEIDTGH